MADVERREVLNLVKRLDERELAAAKRYLEYLRDQGDPLLELLRAAPVDDEPVTKADRAAMRRAERDFAAGRTLTTKELKKKLGL
jgi:hypothetical protein